MVSEVLQMTGFEAKLIENSLLYLIIFCLMNV